MQSFFILVFALALISCKQSTTHTADQHQHSEAKKSPNPQIESPFTTIQEIDSDELRRAIPVAVISNTFKVRNIPIDDSFDLEKQLKQELERFRGKKSPAIHISASADTPFKFIRKVIRAGAEVEISEVYLTIKKTNQNKAEPNHPFHIRLPTVSGCAPQLCPMFIKIDKSGAIFINTGPDQEMLDSDISSRKLPQLSARLQAFSKACIAGANEPVVQIWADGESSYQRVMDLLTHLRQSNIRTIIFTDLVDSSFYYTRGGCRLPRKTPLRLPIAPAFKPPVEK